MSKIDSLFYTIAADTADFDRSVNATRKEVRQAKQLFAATRTPVEQLAAAEDRLRDFLDRGIITQDTYNRTLARMRDNSQRAERQTTGLSGALRTLADRAGLSINSMADLSGLLNVADRAAGLARRAFQQVTDTLADMDAQIKAASTAGLGVNEFRALSLAAGDAGIASAELEKMLKRLSRVTGDASNEFGQARSRIEGLGIDFSRFAALPVPEQLEAIALAMGRLETRQEQVSAAAQIFESEGRDMVRLFDTLRSEGVEPFRAELQRLGLAMDQDVAERLQAVNDDLADAENRWQGFKEGSVEGLLSPLEEAASLMNEFGVSARGAGRQLTGLVTAWGNLRLRQAGGAARGLRGVFEFGEGLGADLAGREQAAGAEQPGPSAAAAAALSPADQQQPGRPAGRDEAPTAAAADTAGRPATFGDEVAAEFRRRRQADLATAAEMAAEEFAMKERWRQADLRAEEAAAAETVRVREQAAEQQIAAIEQIRQNNATETQAVARQLDELGELFAGLSPEARAENADLFQAEAQRLTGRAAPEETEPQFAGAAAAGSQEAIAIVAAAAARQSGGPAAESARHLETLVAKFDELIAELASGDPTDPLPVL